MRKQYILIGIFLLIILLQSRNIENFKNSNTKETLCEINTKTLNKINLYEKQACKKNDNKTDTEVNNNRLNCRQIESKKIYLDKNNNQSWCKDVEIKPELLKHNKVGDFTGFNNLEYTGVDPRPMENLDVDESSYPFNINMVNTDFLNLDNKQIK